MSTSTPRLNASAAAARLGVSIKALRLYERHGLVTPERTPAGYRAYGPDDLARAADIAALRALGLGLAQVARVLDGDARSLDDALAAHEAALDHGIQDLVRKVDRVHAIRAGLARGRMPADGELTRLADALPGAAFVGLDRLENDGAAARDVLRTDPALKSRVDRASAALAARGATPSAALTALLVALEAEGPRTPVVDMIEQDLDRPTQQALIARLREQAAAGMRPLFLLTRSSAILDLSAVGPHEAIILCPANHSPPSRVAPYPGSPGYEAVATCLASPETRARLAHPPEAA
ncbi:MerR family transcriptional regulator [Burkholderia cepacia]|uniref:MerR family transcriptional regulator n=1 Tax=Burkholderia cepacia TaxID=292 RepID=UPI002ABDF25C|nr:MerR family transcriptional regulator [Burkholderia cepacia]